MVLIFNGGDVCLKEEGEVFPSESQRPQEAAWAAGGSWLGSSSRAKQVGPEPAWATAGWGWTAHHRRGLGGHIGSGRSDLVGHDRLQFYLPVLLRLLDLVGHVLAVLALDQIHQLLRVFANDDGSEVAGDVVPGDAVVVLVVLGGQTRLVVVLLQALDGHANVELGVDGASLATLVIVGLPLTPPLRRALEVSKDISIILCMPQSTVQCCYV